MIDHPYITDPDYSTTVMSWYDGAPHFFSSVPDGVEGWSAPINVFHLAYGTIFVFAIVMCHVWWKRGSFRVRKRQVLDSVLVAVAAIVIGGRLGEAIFYQPEYYFSHPMRILTNASGFTIHGMILFTIIVFWFWARWIKRPWFHLLDQSVIFVAFGTILGRIANFMSADLWGRESSLPWAMRFPMRGPLFRKIVANPADQTFMVVTDQLPDGTEAYHIEPWTPDQGIEIPKDGVFYDYPVGSHDSSIHEIARQVLTTPRHPSQLYQAITEGLVLLVILILVRRKATKVGQLSAWFLVSYGLLRTFAEFFRQPEPGLGFLFGLTRGQLLSLSMVIGGVILFIFIKRKPILIDTIPTDAPGFTPQVKKSNDTDSAAVETEEDSHATTSQAD
ncbi:MAG: prolipoprotein diacylglyceryl transferase [Planctomycetes bacterium]|nr:prolipoprotein diacylglyceryl transferase [Planctomycetota bacterium]